MPYLSKFNLNGTTYDLKSSVDAYLSRLRFKNLGNSFTEAQATALANGDFSDFWNGDYWEINDITWRIVDNTGWARRRGDTNFDSPSLVIMPDTYLFANETYLIDNASDSGHGYKDCAYRTRTDGKGRAQCKTIIANAFGSSHIANHREMLSTGRDENGATSSAWSDADVELPSESNIYGHQVWGKSTYTTGSGHNQGDRWGQFRLFELAPYMAFDRPYNYWLRDIVNATEFAVVMHHGNTSYNAPSNPNFGIRPYFILK